MDVGYPPCTACHGLNDPAEHNFCVCGASLCQSDDSDTSLTNTPSLAAGPHVAPCPASLLDHGQQTRNPVKGCPDVTSPRLGHRTTSMTIPGATVLMLRPCPSLPLDMLKLLLSGPLPQEEESSLISPTCAFLVGPCSPHALVPNVSITPGASLMRPGSCSGHGVESHPASWGPVGGGGLSSLHGDSLLGHSGSNLLAVC